MEIFLYLILAVFCKLVNSYLLMVCLLFLQELGNFAHGDFSSVNRFYDIVIAVRTGHEQCFKLGRRQINSLTEHFHEPYAEGFLIGGGGGFIVVNIVFVEENAEHGAGLVNLHFDTGVFGGFCYALQ